MTPPTNDGTQTADAIEASLHAAQDELTSVARMQVLTDDPFRPILQAQFTMLKGMEAVYSGLRGAVREALSAAERQRSELTAFVLKQRTELVADFIKQHEAALARAQAEELAHQAHVKAGLIDAAKDALRELLRLDRKHTYPRAFAYAAVPAIFLSLLAFAAGWCVRGARNVTEVTDTISSLAALTEITRQNTETMRGISDLMIRGMTSTDIAALVSLHNVVLTTIAKVPADTVPAPCIAAVPERTIIVNGKPIKACVIALKDNATVQGGEFLANVIPARSQR